MEQRWDGPQQVKNLGEDPAKSAVSALFAIPAATKTASSLPHHDVTDGKVGAPDKDGCVAAISALNGAQGGVNASQAEKNKAYSHLASHLRGMGAVPPEKTFGAPAPPAGLELRAQRRLGMRGVPERVALQFGAGGMEMRAKANGTGGTAFRFTGYATVYDYPFEMWDFWGDEFTEKVAQWAGQRTLANGCDVPFLVGHNDAGIPMARTKSGTMTLGEDSHGLHVDAPGLDGSLEQIRQLASAVERGDMDEMSMAFMTMRQDWSPDYMERTIQEYDLHKGDVSVVVFGANDGTAGSSMTALPAEQLYLRRPVGMLRNRHAGERRAADEIIDNGGPPDSNIASNGLTQVKCPYAVANGCGKMNAGGAQFCDGCGGPLYQGDGTLVVDDSGVVQADGSGGSDDQLAARRRRELELLALA
jgi:HK97 family phage prohead protease